MPDRQIQNRAEMNWDEDEPDPRPARDSFTPLFGQPEQNGYLPSKDDQSWREQEALRLGYFTPRADIAQTPDQPTAPAAPEMIPIAEDTAPPEVPRDDAEDLAAEEETPEIETAAVAEDGDFTPRREFAMPDPGRRNRGRIMLGAAAILAAAAIAVAFPQILKMHFWKRETTPQMPNSQSALIPPLRAPDKSVPALTPPAAAPATVPRTVEPAPQPKASPDAGGNGTPAAARNAPPATKPAPAPQSNSHAGEDVTGVAVPGAPAREPASLPRRSGVGAPEKSPDERQDGFYAMVPGPDGTMTYRYFSADPKPKSGADRANNRPKRADREDRGVYAKAPGPDGRMEYRYFPPQPAR